MTTIIRAGLVSQIQHRSIFLDTASASKSACTTLMSTDVERVQQGIRKFHDVWSYLLTSAIGLWLLEIQIGVAMYPVLGLSIGR